MKKQERIVLLGAGNVAWHLAHALHLLNVGETEYIVTNIYSPSGVTAYDLASALGEGVHSTNDLDTLPQDADWYIFAVRDDALLELWTQLARHTSGTWLHTSGSTDLCSMTKYHSSTGVLYPLQTFSKGKVLDFSSIPLYIEASNESTLARIETLAHSLSNEVHHASSEARMALHVAAVLSCNFSNYLIMLAEELLSAHQLPSKALLPLLDEMIEKLHHLPAREAQTGPARRGDQMVIERHLKLLHNTPELEQLYRLLSEGIRKRFDLG